MVAVVAGNGLGLFNASLNSLGGVGGFGQGGLGQAGGQATVNASNGNLVLRFTDEQLSAMGQDLFHTRTYNAQGALTDGDADGWRWDGERKVVLSGTRNTTGSSVVRATGDGHETRYAWNGSAYKSNEGDGAHDSLAWDAANGQWLCSEGSTHMVERYDGATGRIASMTDRSAVMTSYSYDTNGRLAAVKDNASGQELVLIYNGAGKLARLDTRTVQGGALTQQVYYGYDTLGRLTSVSTDLTPADNSIADGNVYTSTYAYDANSFRVARVSQSDGSAASFTYVLVDGEYRVQTVNDASGTTTFAYNTGSRRTDVTNGLNQQWSYYYDAGGQLIQVQTPAVSGQRLSTYYAYDVDGNVIRITDGLGNVVSYQYDANGNRILERDSSGTTVTRTYDTANQLLNEIRYTLPATWNSNSATWTDPPASSAQVTRYLYDGNNRPSAMISADGNVTRYLYSVWGLLVREISYGDATYDLSALTPTQVLSSVSLNAWVAARDATRSTLVDLTYDYRGNLSQRKAYGTVNSSGVGVMDASTVITEYVHDQASQLLQTIVTRGAGRTEKTTLVSTVYDGMGRLISQVDASGTRTTTYNSASRTVSTTNTVGQTLTQSFDAAGRLISLTQTAAGVVTRTTQYVYDAMGRQTMVQDMTGVRTYTFYDEAGRVSAQVDGIGAVVEYVYNAAGQRTEERRYATLVLTGSWYNGTAVIKTLVSDIRPAATAADRSTRYTYDARGRLSTSTDAVGTVTTKIYDGRGQLVREQTGDRTTRYFFDASGRQVAQLDAEGYLSENVFDASGRRQQVIRYATATALASRAGGTLAELRPATGDNLRAWFFYDSAGRQTGSIDEQQFVTEVVYDEATHQQKTIRYGTAYAAEITAGTRFASVKAGVQTSAVIHTTTLAYDAMGRVSLRTATDGSVTAYEYDTAGRLMRETAAQGTNDERSTRTRYDAFGQAIGKLLGEASTRVITGMTDDQVAAIYAQYGLTYSYDAAGRAASVRDAQGNRSVSYYDATGRLTHVVNALGEVSETVYNAFGEASEKTSLTARLSTTDTAALTGGLLTLPVKTLVQAIRNAASDNRRTYGYDTRGLLISSTDALGFLTRYGYNGFGEQISVTRTLASGSTVTDSVSYNKRGEAIASVEDVGGLARTTATGYDAFGRVISRVDGRGLTSNVIYSGSGRRIHHSNALGQSETTDYDAFGRVLVSTDALGKTTTYTYNDATRSMTVTTPDGVSVNTVKNRHGQTLTLTDGAGKLTTYSYDKTGQLLTTLNALSQGSTNAYDNAGRLLSVTDALGRLTRYTYDASNRVVSRTAANGAVTRYTFDGQGRQVRVIEAQGLPEQLVTDYAYDRNGQVLIVTQDPDGLKLTTTYTYDGAGQQVQMARGTSASPNQQIVLYAFDKLGRRTSERLDPNGINLTTAYRYNGNDQVTRKIDPAGVSTWYVYDNAGRLTDSIDALGGVIRNTYDGSGRITRTTRFATAIAGSVVNTLGDAPASVSPSVNGAADQSTRYVHDDMGRVRYSIDARGGVTETVYSLTGKMAKSIRYNQVIPTATPQTLAATAASLASSGAQPVTTSYIYNEIGQLTSVTDAADKTESYTYDAVGNRKTLTNKNGAVWRYNYDNLNRLVEEISPAITVASISATGVVSTQVRALVTTVNYDALGHVLSRTEGRLRGNVNDSALLDDLSQARTTRYEYDAVGHQVRITSPGWYNKSSGAFQQSTDISTPANTFQVTTDVTYDALGNAVRNRIRINNTGAATSDFADSYKVYDVLGRLTHDVDTLRGVTAYTYDAQGNLLATKRYANALTAAVPAAGYYKAGDITVTTLVASPTQDRTLVSTYDALGRKTAVQQDQVSLYTFTGTVASSSLITAAPTTVYTYNALGQLIRETQIARNSSGATLLTGASTFYYYDLGSNRVGAVDGLGYYTRMEYDAFGKLSRQVEYSTKLGSWSEGLLPAAPASNSNDRANRFTYDAMGRMSSVTQENVRYWQQSINAQSNGVSASQVTGSLVISQTTYDGVGNVLTQRDAAGNVITKGYNAVGHVSKIIEPARASAQAGVVDPFSTALVVASPTISYVVNAFGQVISETREAGKNAGNLSQSGLTQTSRTQYDVAGYTIKSIDAGNAAINYKVDVAGRVLEESRQTSVVLSAWTVNGSAVARNQTIRRTYGYNLLGEQVSTTDWFTASDNSQKSTVNSVLYNRFGEVTSQLLNGATRVSYSYNQVGRAVQQENAQGVTQVDYDLAGNTSRSNQIGDAAITTDDRITYTRFDSLGRAIEQHLPAFEANTNADTLNNVTLTLTTPIIQQSYDRWGNVLSRIDARGYVTTYSYDHNNKQLTETLPVTDILRQNGTSYRASLIHEKRYDASGLLIQEVDLVGPYAGMATNTELRSRQHVYNAAGELTRDVDALGYSRNYRVDSNGNRVATQDATGTVSVDTYDAMDHQLTHAVIRNGVAVTLLTNQYDQAGRLVGETTGSTAVEETLVSTGQANATSVNTGNIGNTKYTLFDERGNIIRTRNESKAERSYEYNEYNRKIKETDGLNNTLTWTFNEADFGRLTGHKDLGGRVFNYEYTKFGQVAKETIAVPPEPGKSSTVPVRSFTYYKNGLVSVITDVYSGVSPSRETTLTDTRASQYAYNLSGAKIREVNVAQFSNAEAVLLYDDEENPPGAFEYTVFGSNVSSLSETRTKLNEIGQLKEIKSLAGSTLSGVLNSYSIFYNYSGEAYEGLTEDFKRASGTAGWLIGIERWLKYGTSALAGLESLKYEYDELGNRRLVHMDTTSQSRARTVIDNWYKYDAEGKVLVAEGYSANGEIVAGKVGSAAKGYLVSYDASGRRQTLEKWGASTATSDVYNRSNYIYNDLGQVLSSSETKVARVLGNNTSQTVQSVGASSLLFTNAYNERGNKVSQINYTNGVASAASAYLYRGDNQLISQLSYNISSGVQKLSQASYFGESGMMDAVGNQRAYRYAVYKPDGASLSYTGAYSKNYAAFEGYKESNVVATWSYGGTAGVTTLSYTDRGELLQYRMKGASNSVRKFSSNREGQFIARQENNGTVQSYIYFNGNEVATVGNAGAPEITDTLQPISSEYPGRVPGSYIVNDGDTLVRIAQTVWGDASMWYLIADANGLDAERLLVAGESIIIPNVVSSHRNSATTFKPYNPGEVIGDTTPSPTLPPPPKPKKSKSGGIAAIVMVVVAIVATVLTAGAAAPAAAAVAGSTALGGIAATGAAVLTGAAGITMGTMGAAFLGGVVGSAASQLVGKAMGAVDSFSWSKVAASGVGAGIGAAVGNLVAGGRTAQQLAQAGSYGKIAAGSVLNSLGNYAASKAIGLEASFSWVGMASAALTSVAAAGISNGMGFTTDNFKSNFFNSMIGAQVSSGVQILIGKGGKLDYGNVAADAFGNAFGNGLIEASLGGDFFGPASGDLSQKQKIVQRAFDVAESRLKAESLELAVQDTADAETRATKAKGDLANPNIPRKRGEAAWLEEVYVADHMSDNVYLPDASTDPVASLQIKSSAKILNMFDTRRVGAEEITKLGMDPSLFSNVETGFFAALYKNEATGRYYVANRGTATARDAQTDVVNNLGFVDAQYEDANRLVLDVNAVLGEQVTYVGHSLGGGRSSSMAMRVDGRAITFNAAGVHPRVARELQQDLSNAPVNIQAIYVQGDLVSIAQDSRGYDIATAILATPIVMMVEIGRAIAGSKSSSNFGVSYNPEAIGQRIMLPSISNGTKMGAASLLNPLNQLQQHKNGSILRSIEYVIGGGEWK
ncbi:hypothetical protein PS664_02187 [Pseudomonas fluorescens]|nr:hypothetical protein PS664_02187 [Pseudomonas fluorescens]